MPKLIVNLRKKIQDLGVLENTEKSSAPLTMKLLKNKVMLPTEKTQLILKITAIPTADKI